MEVLEISLVGSEGSRVASGEEGVQEAGVIRESWLHGTGSEEGNRGAARRGLAPHVCAKKLVETLIREPKSAPNARALLDRADRYCLLIPD